MACRLTKILPIVRDCSLVWTSTQVDSCIQAWALLDIMSVTQNFQFSFMMHSEAMLQRLYYQSIKGQHPEK